MSRDVSRHDFVERELDRCITIKRRFAEMDTKRKCFSNLKPDNLTKIGGSSSIMNMENSDNNSDNPWIIYFVSTKFRNVKHKSDHV